MLKCFRLSAGAKTCVVYGDWRNWLGYGDGIEVLLLDDLLGDFVQGQFATSCWVVALVFGPIWHPYPRGMSCISTSNSDEQVERNWLKIFLFQTAKFSNSLKSTVPKHPIKSKKFQSPEQPAHNLPASQPSRVE